MTKRIALVAAVITAGLVLRAFVDGRRDDGNADDEVSIQASVKQASLEARQLGEKWRDDQATDTAYAYADALMRAGMYETFLDETKTSALLSFDPDAQKRYRAEALLRLRRFAAARDEIGGREGDPFAALVRARAIYALSANRDRVMADLSQALRASQLTSAAWLLRARVELDDNEFEAAQAAARRARDTGAAPATIQAVTIEAEIRGGDLESAAASLAARERRSHKKGRGLALDVDIETARLAAMAAARAGDFEEASRLFDASLAAHTVNSRDPLLAAIFKWGSGDIAQALAGVRKYRDHAPDDWVGLDIEAGLLRALDRQRDAAELVEKLTRVNPDLARLRRVRTLAAAGDLDAVFAQYDMIEREVQITGAAAFLMGPNPGAPAELAEINHIEADRFTFATQRATAGPSQLGRLAVAHLAFHSDPIDQALAGAAFADAGQFDQARAAFESARKAAPAFFAPAARTAQLEVTDGAPNRAVAVLQDFLSANPDRDEARLMLAEIQAGRGDHCAAVRALSSAKPALVYGEDDAALLAIKSARRCSRRDVDETLDAARTLIDGTARFARMAELAGEDALAAQTWRDVLAGAPADRSAQDGYLRSMEKLNLRMQALAVLAEIARRSADEPQFSPPAGDVSDP
ncbi:MAG: hypothetical protein R3C51_01785 [Parvularculaceae bacterium]